MFEQILEGLANSGGQEAVATPTGLEDPMAKLSALEKLGIGLGGIDAVNNYRRQGLDIQKQQMEGRKLEALKALGDRMRTGELDREGAALEYANITGDYSNVFGVGARPPAALQEWGSVQRNVAGAKTPIFTNETCEPNVRPWRKPSSA